MPRSDYEPSRLVPFLTTGQAENFFVYQALGTGMLWALGGLTGGFTLAMVAGCFLGAVVDRMGGNKGEGENHD